MLKSEKGMTLIEVLASIVIISVVLTTFFAFFIQSHINTAMNSDKLTASQLSEAKLSTILRSTDSDVLHHSCSLPTGTATVHLSCFDYTSHIGKSVYHTYVFIQAKDDSGLYPVISRTYYRAGNYTELYNYYSLPGQ